MTDLRAAAQQALEACPFCGNEPSFSGNASDWKDESRYVELSLGCCASMTEQIGWRRARDMTHEAKTAELQNKLRLKWNARAALAQQEQEQEECRWLQDGDEGSSTWQASCSRRYFMLEDGTPTDNRMSHCCYCGKKLVEVPIEQEDDHD